MSAQGIAALVVVGVFVAFVAAMWFVYRSGRLDEKWERISLGMLFAATAGAFALSGNPIPALTLCICTAVVAVMPRPRR